ncbi:MAG: lipid-A-disaccharide synthase [Pirellulaceae bacterium]|nr:MAG: lipid-A-disaccharide synthase [Pirellulaceae bacterium]
MPCPEVFFSVGEPSGDLHAARLIEHLTSGRRLAVRGFGGPWMQQAGCRLDYPLTDLAVVGVAEVLPKLRQFFRIADQASEIFAQQRPAGVVLVDFPGFNWHIAKRAKAHGIPVFYYLPPQLWAWASWRITKVRRYVDHVLCALPIEHQWFANHGISCEYVGHPFFDQVQQQELDQPFVARWSDDQGLTIAVLPGSRTREIRTIWPMQLAAIRELSVRHPHARFLVACLTHAHRQRCESLLSPSDRRIPIHFFVQKTSEIIEVADCALMKSGSVSLEMMARGTPAVVVYHLSRSTYEIAKRFVHVDSMTLPNLLAGKKVMPEFLAVGKRTATTIERTIAAMDRLMGDRDERIMARLELARLTRRFGKPGASQRAAAAILARLEGATDAGSAAPQLRLQSW